MNSDRTGFYAFLGATGVAALLAIVSLMNPFGSSTSDIETGAQELSPVAASTPVGLATPHPTAVLTKPTPTPTPTPKQKPKPTATEAPASTSAVTTTTSPAQPIANTTAPSTTNANQGSADTTGTDNTGTDNTGTDNGEATGDESTGDETPTATTGGGTTGSVGGPTSSNGSRALSASEAFTYVAFAQVGGRISVFDSPNGQEIQTTYQWLDGSVTDHPITNPTVFGNTLALRVVSGQPGDEWLKVALPLRPNGQTAWVRGSDFQVGSSGWYIEVNVSSNTVSVWNGEELMVETTAVTGSSSTPTPLASGFVEEIINGPSAAYGPKLLSLGIFSNAHNTFGDGVPKIALHGTNQPGLMGQYASNGCVRIPNEVISQVAGMVPVGTRVQIVG